MVCIEIVAHSYGQCQQFDELKKFNDFRKQASKAYKADLKTLFDRYERVTEAFDSIVEVGALPVLPFTCEQEQQLFESVL